MRILDENDNEISAEEADSHLGTLSADQIFVKHHDALPYIERKTHWETLANGVHIEVVDVEGQDPMDAWDEYEDILRWKPYTAEELVSNANAEAAQARRAALPFLASQLAVLVLSSVPDDQLDSVGALVPEWDTKQLYETGQVVRYQARFYRALQAVPVNEGHSPDQATSLWKQVGKPGGDGVWPWMQPLGATDAYTKDSKVLYDGKTWTSLLDGNVWKPGVYGWKPENDTMTDEWPEWTQPSGATDTYMKGAKVSHNGSHWVSDVDYNVWEPGVSQWTKEES